MQIKRKQNSLKRYCFIESDHSIHPEGIPGDYSSKLFSLSFFLSFNSVKVNTILLRSIAVHDSKYNASSFKNCRANSCNY